MKRLFALVLLAVGFATSAHADYVPATWTDSADIGGSQTIHTLGSYTYTHDLTDGGFRPVLDKIETFTLSLNMDGKWWQLDSAVISLPDSPWWAFDFQLDLGANGGVFGGWSGIALANLNSSGLLSVTITSVLGDFNLLGSTLNATGKSYTGGATSVPEPGALGLLGVGLLGMALSMRRRKQAIR